MSCEYTDSDVCSNPVNLSNEGSFFPLVTYRMSHIQRTALHVELPKPIDS